MISRQLKPQTTDWPPAERAAGWRQDRLVAKDRTVQLAPFLAVRWLACTPRNLDQDGFGVVDHYTNSQGGRQSCPYNQNSFLSEVPSLRHPAKAVNSAGTMILTKPMTKRLQATLAAGRDSYKTY